MEKVVLILRFMHHHPRRRPFAPVIPPNLTPRLRHIPGEYGGGERGKGGIKEGTKLGKAVQLRFIISQHVRDKALLEIIMKNFNPRRGSGTMQNGRNNKEFTVTSFKDRTARAQRATVSPPSPPGGKPNIIIPFWDKYPIQGVKSSDYADFCLVVDLMKNKVHLTKEGLEQITSIKIGMNTGRSHAPT